MDNLVQCGTELTCTEMSPQGTSQLEIGSLHSDGTLAIGWTGGYDEVDGQDKTKGGIDSDDEVDAPPALIWDGKCPLGLIFINITFFLLCMIYCFKNNKPFYIFTQ